MGERHDTGFPLTFNRSIKVEARPERLTGDAGALILREIDERLGWTETLARRLDDDRQSELITHSQVELLRTRLYLIALGHKDQDDADFYRHDPAFRMAVSERRGQAPLRTEDERDPDDNTPDGLASQPSQSRLVDRLATEHNRAVLRDSMVELVGSAIRAERGHRFQDATLDIDVFPIDVHGGQVGSKYNGYYHRRVFKGLVAQLDETEDFLGARLLEGTDYVHPHLEEFVPPLLDRIERDICAAPDVRFDAEMVENGFLEMLEARGVGYCGRLPTNAVLDRLAEPLVKRPVGRPTDHERAFCHELSYAAESWDHERRIVLVVIDRPYDLFLDYFFLVTNWSEKQLDGDKLLAFYRRRGTHEGHLAELKNTMEVALSSTSRPKSVYGGKAPKRPGASRSKEQEFACNEATLLLYVWAFNLANRARYLVEKALPRDRGPSAKPRLGGWSLDQVRERVLRVAARFLLHSRQIVVVIGESSAELWNALSPLLARVPFVPIPDG